MIMLSTTKYNTVSLFLLYSSFFYLSTLFLSISSYLILFYFFSESRCRIRPRSLQNTLIKWFRLTNHMDGAGGRRSTLLIRRPSPSSKPAVFYTRTLNTVPCSISIISWNRITGPSNAGCAQANIFVRSGELGVRSPATKRFI